LPRIKRPRRAWSADEKQRIVEQASVPGASVADVARRHGVNANLVFKWCKTARAGAAPDLINAVMHAPGALPVETLRGNGPCGFVSIGVVGQAEAGNPVLAVGSSSAAARATSSARMPLSRLGPDERPGVIEIDLAGGVRLRVDAFVNERALRRVLAVLKTAS
jgi:transposase